MWRKIETFPCYRVFHADSLAFLIVILKLDFFNDEKLCLKYNYRKNDRGDILRSKRIYEKTRKETFLPKPNVTKEK